MSRSTKDVIRVMNLIVEDCTKDVKEYEHAPFTGKTLGTLHGILEAKIEAVAQAVKDLAELIENNDASK